MAEERIKARDFVDRFKLALVSHDPGMWIEKMYPDWTKPTHPISDTGMVEVVEDFDPLDTEGEWRFEEKVTPEEAENVWQEIMAQKGGTITLDDVDGEGWQ